jgi:hypothetical protein
MNAWLRCSLSPGMFPNEYAVELDTQNAGKISFFIDAEKAKYDDQLILVKLLNLVECENNAKYVYLPAYPFEITTRVVKVSRTAFVPIT